MTARYPRLPADTLSPEWAKEALASGEWVHTEQATEIADCEFWTLYGARRHRRVTSVRVRMTRRPAGRAVLWHVESLEALREWFIARDLARAEREEAAARRAERRAKDAERRATEHGTYQSYTYRGCRCAECRKANATRQRANRAKASRSVPPPAKHGTVGGYRYYGCRCQPCTTACTEYNRPFVRAHAKRQEERRA